jgi:hypothetical protein
MEDGYAVVARNVESGAICAHSYAERTAMKEKEFAMLRLEAQQERASTRRRGRRHGTCSAEQVDRDVP